MKIKRTSIGGDIPVFPYDKGSHMALAGFNLDTTGLATGDIVPAGAVLGFDEQLRKAYLVKGAKVVEALAVDGTAVKVEKGHLFKANEFVVNDAGIAAKINSIDTSNALYDVLNTATALGVMAEGAALSSAKAAATEDGELLYEPKGLNNSTIKIDVDDANLVDVRIRTTVYARRIPAVVKAVEKALPNIFFSQSF